MNFFFLQTHESEIKKFIEQLCVEQCTIPCSFQNHYFASINPKTHQIILWFIISKFDGWALLGLGVPMAIGTNTVMKISI